MLSVSGLFGMEDDVTIRVPAPRAMVPVAVASDEIAVPVMVSPEPAP